LAMNGIVAIPASSSANGMIQGQAIVACSTE
jgi:hypothetical protein